jgi:hypothetical protein
VGAAPSREHVHAAGQALIHAEETQHRVAEVDQAHELRHVPALDRIGMQHDPRHPRHVPVQVWMKRKKGCSPGNESSSARAKRRRCR